MIMNTGIDTLRIYERLKSARLEDTAAKEIASVLKETIDDNLATKVDLERLKSELKAEIIKWVAGMLIAQAAMIAAIVKLL